MFMWRTNVRQLGVGRSVVKNTSPERSLDSFSSSSIITIYVGQTKPTCRMLTFKDKHKTYLCPLGNYLTPLFRWRPSFRGVLSFRVDQTTEITERKSWLMYHIPSCTRFYSSFPPNCHPEIRKEPLPQLGVSKVE